MPYAKTGAALLCALTAASASAAELVVEPSADGRLTYTDNLSLAPGVSEGIWSVSAAAAAALIWRSPTAEIAADARISPEWFPDDEDLNVVNQYYNFRASNRDERNRLGLAAGFIEDTTLQTELLTTGVVQQRRSRQLAYITPEYEHAFNERVSLGVDYSHNRVDYEPTPGLVNYSDNAANVFLQGAWSERTVFIGTVLGRLYETEGGIVETETRGATLGAEHQFTERLALSFTAGYRYSRTRFKFSAGEFVSDDEGRLLDARVEYQYEKSALEFFAGQDVAPTGSAQLVETQRAGFNVNHSFSQKLRGGLNALWLSSRFITGLGPDTTYFRIEPTLSWQFDRRLNLAAGYFYQESTTDGVPQSATANTAYLTLTYFWPTIAVPK